jgi:type IV pilus assembly protein PilM
MFLFSKNILGIDLHDHLVQFVELKKRGKKFSLEAYNRLTIPEGYIQDGEIKKEEELKELLKKLLKEANPNPARSKEIALILPTQVTFIHIFHFPANLSISDLRKLIPVEVENILPYAAAEVYWDFTILEKHKDDGQSVLFAATPKVSADQYLKLFNELGFKSVLFGIQPEALQNALAYKLVPEETTMVVELGALATNYLFLNGSVIQKFVSINGGIEDLIQTLSRNFSLSSDELWANWEQHKTEERFQPDLNAFIEEAYKQVQTILKETLGLEEKNLKGLLFTGEFSNLPLFYERAKETFVGKTVLIGDPKSRLIIDDKKFASDPEKYGGKVPYSIYFTDAIGVALRALYGSGRALNLIPDTLKAHFSQQRLALIMGASSLLMTLCAAFFTSSVFYQNRQLSFSRLNLEIQKSGIEKTLFGTRYIGVKEELTEFNKEVTALKKIDQTLISLPLVLEDVLELIPSQVQVLAIDFIDESLSVEITGISTSREALLALQDNLEAAEFVKDFDIPLSSYDQKTDTSFTVSILLDFPHLPFYASSENN